MKLKMSTVSAIACLLMSITGIRLGTAQQVQQTEPEWVSEMYQEDWLKLREGVLQRDAGEGRLETLSYGSDGLQWVVQGYEEQVEALEQRYSQSPNAKLAEVIAQLKAEIARLQSVLQEASPEASIEQTFAQETIESCPNSAYGGSASAGPQSGVQGVTATARAYFYNDCGHLGDTFAWAYAHAAEGTVETTNNQNDPKNGGTWLESSATASAKGSTQCESAAQAAVTVTVNGEIRYFQTPHVQNFDCPSVEPISRYTLDFTSWEQTGAGTLGPLALIGTSGYALIDRNYAPVATSGLPQAGIAFSSTGYTGYKLEGQPVDTISAYGSASVITLEFTGRITDVPASTATLMGVTHWDGTVNGGSIWGARIDTDQVSRLIARTFTGAQQVTSSHFAPAALVVNATVDDSFRWVWTESSAGSATGTGQWWRKISGAWQPWGSSKSGLGRPVGHAKTKMRLHGNEAGSISGAGFDFLEASVTIDPRPSQPSCQPQ